MAPSCTQGVVGSSREKFFSGKRVAGVDAAASGLWVSLYHTAMAAAEIATAATPTSNTVCSRDPHRQTRSHLAVGAGFFRRHLGERGAGGAVEGGTFGRG